MSDEPVEPKKVLQIDQIAGHFRRRALHAEEEVLSLCNDIRMRDEEIRMKDALIARLQANATAGSKKKDSE